MDTRPRAKKAYESMRCMIGCESMCHAQHLLFMSCAVLCMLSLPMSVVLGIRCSKDVLLPYMISDTSMMRVRIHVVT